MKTKPPNCAEGRPADHTLFPPASFPFQSYEGETGGQGPPASTPAGKGGADGRASFAEKTGQGEASGMYFG